MHSSLSPRRIAAVLTFLGLVFGSTAARADFAYGFAEQTISGLSVTPSTGTLTPTIGVTTTSFDGSTFNGSGPSNSDPNGLDALQSFSGPTAPAPENFFTKYATFAVGSPLPAGTAPTGPGPFGRGDSQIASLVAGSNLASVVGEAYVNSISAASGNGGVTASFSFTLSSAASLGISYNFLNDIYVATGGPLSGATASYSFNITVKDVTGAVAFSASPSDTNLSLVAPPQGGEIRSIGSGSVTTSTLSAGTQYTLIFDIQASASARIRAVPEPGSVALLAIGGFASACYALRQRRKVIA